MSHGYYFFFYSSEILVQSCVRFVHVTGLVFYWLVGGQDRLSLLTTKKWSRSDRNRNVVRREEGLLSIILWVRVLMGRRNLGRRLGDRVRTQGIIQERLWENDFVGCQGVRYVRGGVVSHYWG